MSLLFRFKHLRVHQVIASWGHEPYDDEVVRIEPPVTPMPPLLQRRIYDILIEGL